MRSRLLVLLLAAAFFSVLAGCEENPLEPDLRGTIVGQVLDFETLAPLGGVGVTTNPATGSLLTDDEGRFEIDDIAAGSYAVSGRLSGYDANTVTVAVRDGETTQAILFLEQEAEEDTTSAADFEAAVLGFSNRVGNDTTSVVVEYRARNAGTVDIPYYEIYFQILTTGRTYFQEVTGTDLLVGQSDIGEFEEIVGTDTVTSVQISGTFFEGDEGP